MWEHRFSVPDLVSSPPPPACSICFCLRHIKCAKLKSIISDWTCASSLASVLPVYGSSIEDAFNDLADVYESTAEQPSQESIRILQEKASHLRIMHLNTQTMFSMFNEFLTTINEYPLDVITLSRLAGLRASTGLYYTFSEPRINKGQSCRCLYSKQDQLQTPERYWKPSTWSWASLGRDPRPK